MSEKKRRLPQKRRNCVDCEYYRAMVFRDDGSDAFCGRCTFPTKGRIRPVRSGARKACDDFRGRSDSDGEA